MAHGQPKLQVAPWRAKAQAVFALALCSGALIFGAALFVNSFRERSAISAYRAAATCSATAALSSDACRFDGEAKVLSTHVEDQLHAMITLDSLPGRTFDVTLRGSAQPPGGPLTVGGSTTATLWNGHITELDGEASLDNPENASPGSDLILGPFFGLFGLIGLPLSVKLAREAWVPERP